MAIATLEEYLREFSVEIGDRILASFPALHTPGDPVPPILGKLLRKPFAAQTVAIAGAVKKLRQANSVAIIAEMGTGKTLMAMAISFAFCAGRPYACLFVVPPQLVQKTAREILQTISGTRSIWSARSQRTAAPEWPDCPRWRSHHAHRHEAARQIQISMGPLGC
jgi:hypothetical protein